MKTPSPFPRGARVMFIGDSITCNGGFISLIQEYYLTRLPEYGVRLFNAGVSGGGTRSAQRYLDADLALYRPTHAVIMLGMNDVNRTVYFGEQDAAAVRAMQEANKRYFDGMSRLCEQLHSLGIPFILCTPTPFDDEMQTDAPAGKNLAMALTGYGHFCAGLAEKYGAPIVDYNTPLTAINRTLQRDDPTRSIVGQDRVHPGPDGHGIIARLFLRAQGFTDVEEPTAEGFLRGDYAPVLSEKNAARKAAEEKARRVRNTAWFVLGEDWQAPMEVRMEHVAKYLADEEAGVPHNPYITGLVREYETEAPHEEEYKARLLALSETLYE